MVYSNDPVWDYERYSQECEKEHKEFLIQDIKDLEEEIEELESDLEELEDKINTKKIKLQKEKEELENL